MLESQSKDYKQADTIDTIQKVVEKWGIHNPVKVNHYKQEF